MPEPHDPLRSLFEQAAAAGRSRAVPAPMARIAERGRRAHRRRLAALAAGCLVLVGGTVATSTSLRSAPAPAAPATGATHSTPPPAPAPTTGLPPSSGGPSPSKTPTWPPGTRMPGGTPTESSPPPPPPEGAATTTSAP
ncbi:hypothetical protein [Streptomyces sp. B1I3]|uniref:hypothetical protein n=1 Tax=Streptomyces sp. B1I3 TaxID=3042264 RepID=UPI00277E56B8|nr:hypothetical protein [Streptomyces sp. B1I3]MDQ0794265.1 hypothetical protein [Streptomyces sp. B1I3]